MKALIIGGGLGGLATALRLSTTGWDVTLCEAGPTLGGKMNCLRHGGYTFDTGPSLITMPGVFAELFSAAGEQIGNHVSFMRVDPHAEYRFPDGAHLICPADHDEWRKAIRTVEPKDVEGFDKLHALGRRIYELSRRTFFRHGPQSRPALEDLAALRYFPVLRGWGRYAGAVARFFRSPYLRQIYNRYPTYVGSSPYLCPATLLVIPFLEREFGAWHVRGGLYRIVESIAGLLESRGVELRCNAQVTAIERAGSRVVGARLADGTQFRAGVIVMNGDAATAAGLLGDMKAEPPDPRLRSLSGFVIMAGVRSRPAGLAHHTVLFSSDYRNEFDDLFARRRFPEEPTVYISAPAATDAAVSTEGGDALFVMANAPSTGEEWKHADIDAAARKVLFATSAAGVEIAPDEVFSVFDPGRFARQYLAPGGAIYGTHSHGWRRAFFRPPNRSPRVRGLYFAGGSTHPGGGTPTVLMSARIVAQMIDAETTEADARA